MTKVFTPSRKKVLFIDLGAPFGGVEAYVVGLARLLAQDAELFCVCALPQLAVALRALDVRVYCVPILRNRWCKAIRFMVAVGLVPYLIVRFGIDILQVNGYLESLLVLLARPFGCMTIRTSHGPSEVDRFSWYKDPAMYFPRLAALYCLRLFSRVVCVSEVVGEEVRKVVPADRVRVISNWISWIPPYRKRIGVSRCGCCMSDVLNNIRAFIS